MEAATAVLEALRAAAAGQSADAQEGVLALYERKGFAEACVYVLRVFCSEDAWADAGGEGGGGQLPFGAATAEEAEGIAMLAVISLKNLHRSHWKGRGATARVLDVDEKALMRAFLVQPLEIPSGRVAMQLSVLTARLAKTDWPESWPDPLDQLLFALSQGTEAQGTHALYTLRRVLMELSTKQRVRQELVRACAGMFGGLCDIWVNQNRAFAEMLEAELAQERQQLQQQEGQSAQRNREATFVQLQALSNHCVIAVKCMRECMVPSFPHICETNGDATSAFFNSFCEILNRYALVIRNLSADSPMLPLATRVVERMAPLPMLLQKEHPLTIVPVLSDLLELYGGELDAELARPDGAFDPLCINAILLLANTVSCRQYYAAPGGGSSSVGSSSAQPSAAEQGASIVQFFFSPERTTEMCERLFSGLLWLTSDNLNEWLIDPEDFCIAQAQAAEDTSLRAASQSLLNALLDARTELVVGIVREQLLRADLFSAAATSHEITEPVLRVDALLLAAGVGSYILQQYLDLSEWLQATLGPLIDQLVSTEVPVSPPVLVQRVLWTLTCWIHKLEPVSLSTCYQLCGGFLTAEPPRSDAAVRMAAVAFLNAALERHRDHREAYAPHCEQILRGLFSTMHELSTFETVGETLSVITRTVRWIGHDIIRFAQAIASSVPPLWQASAANTVLQPQLIDLMASLVDVLRQDSHTMHEVSAPLVAAAVTPMEGVHLLESGLRLLHAVLRHAPAYTEHMHQLFPGVAGVFALEHYEEFVHVLEAYALLGRDTFFSDHAAQATQLVLNMVGEVQRTGIVWLARCVDTLCLAGGPGMISAFRAGGVLGKLIDQVLNDDNYERDIERVKVLNLCMLARMLVTAPSETMEGLQEYATQRAIQPEAAVAQLVNRWLLHFDSIGRAANSAERRKACVVALLTLLTGPTQEVARGVLTRLEEILGGVADVLGEEAAAASSETPEQQQQQQQQQKRAPARVQFGGAAAAAAGGNDDTDGWAVDDLDAPVNLTALLRASQLNAAVMQLTESDPVHCTDLRDTTHNSLQACAQLVSGEALSAQVERVHVAIRQDLGRYGVSLP